MVSHYRASLPTSDRTNSSKCTDQWKAGVPIPSGTSLAKPDKTLEGEGKKLFPSFMRGVLQWKPEGKKTAVSS